MEQEQLYITLDGQKIEEASPRSFQISKKNTLCGVEYQIVYRPEKQKKVSEICVIFDYDRYLGNKRENDYIFTHCDNTNAPACISKLSDAEIITRDIVLVKSNDGGDRFLSVAMTGAERFYSVFFVNNKHIRLFFNMEGKEVFPDREYILETFAVSTEIGGGEFFSLYADYLAEKYHIVLPEKVQCGWSSWSCFYKTVDENKVLDVCDAINELLPECGMDLIQIDDGWQNGDTFTADWSNSKERFPGGIDALSKKINEKGFRLGLWYAPFYMYNNSEFFKKNPDFNILYSEGDEVVSDDADSNGKTAAKRAFGGKIPYEKNDQSVFPMDISKDNVKEFVGKIYKKAIKDYNCHYFKLDFLVRSLGRCVRNDPFITYDGEYATKVYQDIIKVIRDETGDDAYFLASGAPIMESVGRFQSVRASQDITWMNETDCHPGYWKLIVVNAQNVFLRSYYNGKVFRMDPDALLVRDKVGEVDDLFAPTYEEAKLWATVVAMSGGTVLLNEDVRALSPERLELARSVMPPTGLTACPEDFFEYPLCTKTNIENGAKRMAAVYNWSEDEKESCVTNSKKVAAFDCWSREFVGIFSGNISLGKMQPHSCRVLLLADLNEISCGNDDIFLCDDYNFHMGIDRNTAKDSARGAYYLTENTAENDRILAKETINGNTKFIIYRTNRR